MCGKFYDWQIFMASSKSDHDDGNEKRKAVSTRASSDTLKVHFSFITINTIPVLDNMLS